MSFACSLFLLRSKISLNASYTRIVLLSASAAADPNFPILSISTSASTEKPPSIVPNIEIAFSGEIKSVDSFSVATEKLSTDLISPEKAISMLGTMLGGFSVEALVEILKIGKFGSAAAEALKSTILVYDAFNEIFDLSKNNEHAKDIIHSWAEAEWFKNKPSLAKEIQLTVYKVSGETNTDDFSPAKDL